MQTNYVLAREFICLVKWSNYNGSLFIALSQYVTLRFSEPNQPHWLKIPYILNTLRPRQHGYFPDDIFECIFLKENVWIPIKISLKFVPKSQTNNIPALIQIMAWRRQGEKPLSEPMMVRLPTHICVTRPQWFIIALRLLFIFHN